jgi:hypothetical protein
VQSLISRHASARIRSNLVLSFGEIRALPDQFCSEILDSLEHFLNPLAEPSYGIDLHELLVFKRIHFSFRILLKKSISALS